MSVTPDRLATPGAAAYSTDMVCLSVSGYPRREFGDFRRPLIVVRYYVPQRIFSALIV